jgi:hypothetical protein
MDCPNCHSDQVIAVQDQHFCINCGQMVPEKPHPKPKAPLGVQVSGLPDGVKILAQSPTATLAAGSGSPMRDGISAPTRRSAPPKIMLDHSRHQIPSTEPARVATHRKRGRPKAGKLDAPRVLNLATPEPLPQAPRIASTPVPARPTSLGPKRMNDLAPRKDPASTGTQGPAAVPKTPKRAHAHKVGVPPIHYAPIIAFSLRARVRPRLILLAAAAATSLGVASAYGVWVIVTKGVAGLATGVIHAGPKLIAEAILLAIIYYLGRSLGETAITYGIAREADQRPVTMSRQLGVAINTFGRRLVLDIGFGLAELLLLALVGLLVVTGGANWPIDANLQMALIFTAYLVITYAISALAISRGLAGVNLALTTHKPRTAAKIGWQLFSHRIELIGPRFGALMLELLLAVPLIALAVAFAVAAPRSYHLAVAVAAGLLVWVAGALLGVGTAAWWTTLYRQLVVVDRPASAMALLSGRQPEEARRGPLIVLVAIITLLLAATLTLPWIQFTS